MIWAGLIHVTDRQTGSGGLEILMEEIWKLKVCDFSIYWKILGSKNVDNRG